MNKVKLLKISAQGFFLCKRQRKESYKVIKIGYCKDLNDFNSKIAEYDAIAKMKFIEQDVKQCKYLFALNECEQDGEMEIVNLLPCHKTAVKEYNL